MVERLIYKSQSFFQLDLLLTVNFNFEIMILLKVMWNNHIQVSSITMKIGSRRKLNFVHFQMYSLGTWSWFQLLQSTRASEQQIVPLQACKQGWCWQLRRMNKVWNINGQGNLVIARRWKRASKREVYIVLSHISLLWLLSKYLANIITASKLGRTFHINEALGIQKEAYSWRALCKILAENDSREYVDFKKTQKFTICVTYCCNEPRRHKMLIFWAFGRKSIP